MSMPGTPCNWTFNISEKTLHGPDGAPLDLPVLNQEDTLVLSIPVVERRSFVSSPFFQRFNCDGWALQVSVGSANSILASQNVFTLNSTNDTFAGSLGLNTSGINALADNTEVTLELRMFNGTGYYRAQFAVRIKKSVALAASLEVPATDTALGAREAGQLYVPYSLPAGRGIQFTSEDGTKTGVLYLRDDNTFAIPGLT